MIRVGVVDDQMLVRQGIAHLLELTPDLRVVFQSADGCEALRELLRVDVDVLLLDVRLPGLSGPRLLAALQKAERSPATLMLTTFDDDEALHESMRAGARGFLLKDISAERLANAVRAVAAGETLFQPGLTERALQQLGGHKEPPPPTQERLSRRELEILRLIAAGFSNREIGDALGIAVGTVKNHTSSLLAKLGARDRTRAVLRAAELGYLR